MRYKICGFQVLLSKLFFRNSWRKCFQELCAPSCVVMQLSSNDYFPSIPTDTYLLNHCFNGLSPLPPFRNKKKKKERKENTHLGEGLQISAHQAAEGDNISKNLKLGVQFLSKEKKPKTVLSVWRQQMWPKSWVHTLPMLRLQWSLLKTSQQGKNKCSFSTQYKMNS